VLTTARMSNDEYKALRFDERTEPMFLGGLAELVYRKFPEAPRVRNVSDHELEERFFRMSTPVIVEGSLDWPALKEWTFASLAQKIGHLPVRLNPYTPDRARDSVFSELFTPTRRSSEPGEENCVSHWDCEAQAPFLMKDIGAVSFKETFDVSHKLYGTADAGRFGLLSFAQSNARQFMHRDFGSYDAEEALIGGSAHWIFCGPGANIESNGDGGPDLKRFFADPNVPVFHAVTKPGDVIYIPANSFHRVHWTEDSISLSNSFLCERNLAAHFKSIMEDLLPLAMLMESRLTPYTRGLYRRMAAQLSIQLEGQR